jgi:hypothetical protein
MSATLLQLAQLAKAGTSNTSWRDNLWSPQSVAAVVAAFAAASVAYLSGRSAAKQRSLAREQREIDFRRAQMNELYGPLVMLREASRNFRRILPNGSEWRTVDHIEELQSGELDDERDAVEEILKINKEIEGLLITKAGLYETWPPLPTFETFVSHSMQLRRYWDRGKNQPPSNRLPFPQRFDHEIKEEVAEVRKRLNQLGERGARRRWWCRRGRVAG